MSNLNIPLNIKPSYLDTINILIQLPRAFIVLKDLNVHNTPISLGSYKNNNKEKPTKKLPLEEQTQYTFSNISEPTQFSILNRTFL